MYVFFLELQRLPLNIGAKIPVFFVCFTDIVYICGKYTFMVNVPFHLILPFFRCHTSMLPSTEYGSVGTSCGGFRWLPVAGSAGPAPEVVGRMMSKRGFSL